MNHEKQLNQNEIDLSLRYENYSIAKLAKLVNRSCKIMTNLLKNPNQ